tara:strand:- start:381 stop:629 length:249 start_codon:yes stop_codon:yes gene_type:complete
MPVLNNLINLLNLIKKFIKNNIFSIIFLTIIIVYLVTNVSNTIIEGAKGIDCKNKGILFPNEHKNTCKLSNKLNKKKKKKNK